MYFSWTDDALAFLLAASGHLPAEEIARELSTATGVPLTVNAVRLACIQHHIPLPPPLARARRRPSVKSPRGGGPSRPK